MPTFVWSLLGVNGLFWGVVLQVDDGSVPVGIALMVAGTLLMFVWVRAWRREGEGITR